MTKTYEELVKEMYSNNLFRETAGRDTVKVVFWAEVRHSAKAILPSLANGKYTKLAGNKWQIPRDIIHKW